MVSSEPRSSESGDSEAAGSDLEGLENEIADVPFEVLERLNQDGRGPAGPGAWQAAAEAAKKKHTREHKWQPREVTSKRPVPRFREVIQAPKRPHRDPRFDEVSGHLDKDRFRQQYSFLYNEVLPTERRQIKATLTKEKSDNVKARLKEELTRVEQQIRDEQQRKKHIEVDSKIKAQEKAAVAGGKSPFYLKKSDKRKLELIEKYKELQASGQLDNFMEKRRKKNAAKDHRHVPAARRAMQ